MKPEAPWLRIDVSMQRLELRQDGKLLGSWPVSTAKNGVGELRGSEQTPRGRHYVRARIGEGLPPYAVLRGRRPTGEIWTAEMAVEQPGRDWILGRILWLCGCEPGRNRLGNVDSQRRYIYIHGTPDTEPVGVPLSHGCIRLRVADMVELFARVPAGTVVEIHG